MMKKSFLLSMLATFFIVGCSCEVELAREKDDVKSISLSLVGSELIVGKEASFIVKDDKGTRITSLSKIFVEGNEITGNKYTPSEEGTIEVHATYQTYTSPKIRLIARKETTSGGGGGQGPVGSDDVTPKDLYTPKVLIHDFTGTWCGWCADAIFTIKELHDAYPKNVISVGVHTGSGPDNDQSFDYENYSDFGVEGNPIIWFNNKQNEGDLRIFTEEAIERKKKIGLAINYDLDNDEVSIYVHSNESLSDKKVVVYLVEDKLIADQANYTNNDQFSPSYQKGDPIKNLEHNNVLRKILTKRTGDTISSNAIENNMYSVKYSLVGKKDKIKDIQNTKIIAFVINSNGDALNAQEAKANEMKDFD